MNPKWGIYLRVSTRPQAESGFSLPEQLETLTTYAEERGWDYQVFKDAGVSGQKLEERPAVLELIEGIESGELVGVLVAHDDRLYRDDLVTQLMLSRLQRAGAQIAYPGRNELNLDEPADNFIAKVMGAAAVLDQQLRTKRMKAGLRRTVEAEYWPGGPPPYGYRIVEAEGTKHKRLAENKVEADVLRLVADLIVNLGHSTYSAADYLTANGIMTRKGRVWQSSNLSWQLRRTHLTGSWTYQSTGGPVPMTVPAIFTVEEWNQVQSAIKGKPSPQRKSRRYPLSGHGRGHLYCSCGATMSGQPQRHRIKYTCSKTHHRFGELQCGLLPRTYEAPDLEQAVWDEVVAVLTSPEYLNRLAATYLADVDDAETGDDDRRRIEIKLGELRRQKTAIVRKLADMGSLDFLEDAVADISDEMVVLQRQLDGMEQRDALRAERASIPDRLETLAEQARNRLSEPDETMMAEVFDLLELELHLVEPYRFEGTGSIPIPNDGDGEVSEGGL